MKKNKRKDLSGRRFGKLLVSNESARFPSGKSYVTKWKCFCDCGQERWIQHSSLLAGTRSCGCYARKRVSEANSLEPGLAASRCIYWQYKLRAKRKGLDFDLTFEDFIGLCNKPCFYCGAIKSNECIVEGRNGSFLYNGIDRVDNCLGYKFENCVTACKICNRAKDIMSKEEFVTWIFQAYEFLKDKHL